MKGQRRWTDVIDGGRAHLDDAVEGGHEADFDHLLLRRQSRHARAVGAHVVTLSVILDQSEHTADTTQTHTHLVMVTSSGNKHVCLLTSTQNN